MWFRIVLIGPFSVSANFSPDTIVGRSHDRRRRRIRKAGTDCPKQSYKLATVHRIT
jgi:hypothetical protein